MALGFGRFVDVEVVERRGGVFRGREALVELPRGEHAAQASSAGMGWPVSAWSAKRFSVSGLQQPILEQLGGQLDEIAVHAGAREAGVGHVRQQAVQPMAELVEQRPGVVQAQKRRRALGEVQHVHNDGKHLAVKPLLVAEGAHPGAAAFRGPVEVVAHEKPDKLAAAVRNLENAHIRMINGNAARFLEAQPEQPVRGIENRRDHVVQLEIGHQLPAIDVELAPRCFSA